MFKKWRKKFVAFLSLLPLVFGVVFPLLINAQVMDVPGGSGGAKTISPISNFISTLEAGVVANQEVTFTINSFSPNKFIWSFDSNFDLTAITVDDIDAGTYTLGDNCLGGADMSAVVVGNSIEFTVCGFFLFLPGQSFTFTVGTNATLGAIGVNQITNPAVVGTYFEAVFVMSGVITQEVASLVVPIGGDDSFNVTAVVPVSGGGGGGGGGGIPPSDTTAPNILNLVVSNITNTGARITWNTDENADTKLEYGLTVGYEMGVSTEINLKTSHVVNLGGLTPGTTYHFRVSSKDAANNQAVSGDLTFTTTDDTAPIISKIQVVEISKTSARVTWNTSEATKGYVKHGLTDVYGTTSTKTDSGTEHSVLLTGLLSGTTYHFQVLAEDNLLNLATSPDQTFITLSDPAPANVLNFQVVPGDGKNDLTWTNPPDIDLDGVKILVCLNGFAKSPNDNLCSVISTAKITSFLHLGLVNETTYYYTAYTYDEAGQFASGSLASGTPSAPEEEVLPEPDDPIVPPVEDEEPPTSNNGDSGQSETCGNGFCASGENYQSCPADCLKPEGPVCGNGICEATETETSCSKDCAQANQAEELSLEGFSFFVLDGQLRIPSTRGQVRALPSRSLQIRLTPQDISGEIERIEASLNSGLYQMVPMNQTTAQSGVLTFASLPTDTFQVSVIAPSEPAFYPLAVTAFLADGTQVKANLTIVILGEGRVFEALNGSEKAIENARVLIIDQSTVRPWDASVYSQLNPIITGPNGTYAWYIPDGLYTLRVEKSGYETFETTIQASGRIVNTSVGLTKIPEEEVIPVDGPISSPVESADKGVVKSVQQTVEIVNKTFETVDRALETIRSNKTVEEATALSVPVLSATAVISATALASSYSLLSFLQYLFTSPLLFFGRRKRKGFGVVYNAATKLPIDLATIRLFRLPDNTTDASVAGRLIQSRVTNKEGQYYFLVQPGLYRLQTYKTGFSYPSKFAEGKEKDDKFLDVYHGEMIRVTGKNATIAANIPVDPISEGALQEPKKIIWKRRLRKIQQVFAIGGILISLAVLIIQPSLVTATIFGVQIVIYLLVKRLAQVKKPESWGIVYDQKTKKPLSGVIARIFEPTYNKLLETQVTDGSGRFSFFLGPSEYYAVFEKKGYNETEYRPIDYTKNKDTEEFGPKVKLEPKF